ncbi:hypothetical protein F5Y03DRAFT_389229 [Xylaria venustula]|nr:hypothetical protein F5Y03DRAFT_389229 [Xylaria venustula]
MKEAVDEIKLKLALGRNFEFRLNDGEIAKRDMIKIALQFSTHEDSLKRLSEINQKLDLMMTGNLRNEPYRKPQPQVKLFDFLRAISRSIYNALRSSLSCSCAQSHGVGFGLPTPRVTRRIQDQEMLVKRLDFHLVLANKPHDAKGKTHSRWVWDELVLRLAENPTKARTNAMLPDAADMVVKKPRFARVKFLGDVATELVLQATPPSDSGSKASEVSSVSHAITTNSLGHIPPPQLAARQLVQVKDICHTLGSKHLHVKSQDPYGYLLDETTRTRQTFEVYPSISSNNNDEYNIVHLMDLFSQRTRPSLARKYHIAATVASSILFMHNTRWMPAILTIKDVFLISRHGNVSFDEVYLETKSLQNKEGPASVLNLNPSGEAAVSILYHLGIFLMEVILWKSVHEFWDDENVDLRGMPLEDIFDYTTAKGFARIEGILKRIEWISSPEFREVLEHCIKCDLAASNLSLDDDTFRHAVYNEIVLPLQDIDRVAGGKMIIGKSIFA